MKAIFIELTDGSFYIERLEPKTESEDLLEELSPFKKKSCYDCKNLKSSLSWWCTSKEAIKARGTSFPGCIKCPFWKPDWKMIDDKYKTEENGYIKPIKKLKKRFNKFLYLNNLNE